MHASLHSLVILLSTLVPLSYILGSDSTMPAYPEAACAEAEPTEETNWVEYFKTLDPTCEYLKKNTSASKKTQEEYEDTYGINSHLNLTKEQVAFHFFRMFEEESAQCSQIRETRDILLYVLKLELNSFEAGKLYIEEYKRPSLSFFDTQKKFKEDHEGSPRKIFITLVERIDQVMDQYIYRFLHLHTPLQAKSFEFFKNAHYKNLETFPPIEKKNSRFSYVLDELPIVGKILRTQQKIPPFQYLGQYTGKISLKPRFTSPKGAEADMYAMELSASALCHWTPFNISLVLSSQESGNEFRFLSAASEIEANVIPITIWAPKNVVKIGDLSGKIDIRYNLICAFFSLRDIEPGHQLIAYYGDEFLDSIERKIGRPIVHFCPRCTEPLPSEEPTLKKKQVVKKPKFHLSFLYVDDTIDTPTTSFPYCKTCETLLRSRK